METTGVWTCVAPAGPAWLRTSGCADAAHPFRLARAEEEHVFEDALAAYEAADDARWVKAR